MYEIVADGEKRKMQVVTPKGPDYSAQRQTGWLYKNGGSITRARNPPVCK